MGTEAYCHRDELYYTGDMGRVRADGQLEVLGRADFTIKIRAFKVALGMVEATIKELEVVENAVVLPFLNAASEQPEALAAYVTRNDADKDDEVDFLKGVYDAVHGLLPDYAVPSYWILMEQMPFKSGESRKLDRKALPPAEPHHRISAILGLGGGGDGSGGDDGANADGGRSSPGVGEVSITLTGGSKRIASITKQVFASVLGVDSIGLTENFFEVGGHSLSAAKLVGELVCENLFFKKTGPYIESVRSG